MIHRPELTHQGLAKNNIFLVLFTGAATQNKLVSPGHVDSKNFIKRCCFGQMKGDYLLLVTDVSEAALPQARELLTAIQRLWPN